MTPARRVLVVSHVGRAAARVAALEVVDRLVAAGVEVAVAEPEWQVLCRDRPHPPRVDVLPLPGDADPGATVDGADAVVVLGGDGSILRAAELVRGREVPLVGVNLGHFGFLAENDPDDLGRTVARVVAGDYAVEQRMTVDVRVLSDGEVLHRDWALNEVTLEKASRERMLDVVVEIDGRPLTRFGCDGVVVATPTGSTAYAFSAGGPVVWPEVEALLVAPISAHALFARPLVVQPSSLVALETVPALGGEGLVVADGRRDIPLPPTARIEVTRGEHPVRLARLAPVPFTERLVNKFRLPVGGWRGPAVGA
ncbi:MAG: NAD kinase [Kineosporiaceae bacterium]